MPVMPRHPLVDDEQGDRGVSQRQRARASSASAPEVALSTR